MHLGNVRTALLAWLSARSAGGRMVLRIEDLDTSRLVPGAEAGLLDELHLAGPRLGRGARPGRPVGALPPERARRPLRRRHPSAARERARPSSAPARARDVARAATAPHGEDGPRYPGTCRDLDPAEVAAAGRRPGAAPDGPLPGRRAAPGRSPTGIHGPVDPLGAEGLDDFVIRRADGGAAYQLAVVVDDAAMGITRGGAWRRSAHLHAPAARAVPGPRAGRALVRARPAGPFARPASGWPSAPGRRRWPICAAWGSLPRWWLARWPPRPACARQARSQRRRNWRRAFCSIAWSRNAVTVDVPA